MRRREDWMEDGNTAVDPGLAGEDGCAEMEPDSFLTVSARKSRLAEETAFPKRQNDFLELTWQGRVFCMILGFLELIAIYLVFQIHALEAPVVVTCFLWFLLAVVTAGVIIGAEEVKIMLPFVMGALYTVTGYERTGGTGGLSGKGRDGFGSGGWREKRE